MIPNGFDVRGGIMGDVDPGVQRSFSRQEYRAERFGPAVRVTRPKTGSCRRSVTAVRKKSDGEPLKTILEYAEERGLTTGVITNDALTGATPAATYAKATDRGMTAHIFQQIFTPRFGDGVDVMIGAGRPAVTAALKEGSLDLDAVSQKGGRPVLKNFSEIPDGATRALVMLDSGEFDLQTAFDRTLPMLSANPRGYFLMIEWDTHTDHVRLGLDRFVMLDRVIAAGRLRHADPVHGRSLLRSAVAWRHVWPAAAGRLGKGRSRSAEGTNPDDDAADGQRPHGRNGS